jgi:YVTN family beta-propeller protein
MKRRAVARLATTALLVGTACSSAPPESIPVRGPLEVGIGRLPTGARLDPAGASTVVGAMPLAMIDAPGGRRLILSLSGWRQQGLQVVERAGGRIVQNVPQASSFIGLAASADGRWIYSSGGNSDVVYRYAWQGDSLALHDSLVLGHPSKAGGTRYPAGLALSPDDRTLYVAENLADSLAVVDVATGVVRARLATPRYPYGVVVTPAGDVYVSAWTGTSVTVFAPAAEGLRRLPPIPAGRHPSAMVLGANGTRLFVASATEDRITVIDTRARRVVGELGDTPPGATEGSTPNALALSDDGRSLYVAEADNNAVAVFALGDASAGRAGAGSPRDSLIGRVPVGWYPTALAMDGGTLFVANGKGRGTRANPDGPTPTHPRTPTSRSYTLGQLEGSLMPLDARSMRDAMPSLTERVTRANGWDRVRERGAGYPPIEHIVYVIKENRTYDQLLGDLPQADGDSSLVFFPRAVSPNHHALAERFGIFDRFFVNAEVSPDGHNWSTAAYATDYLEKTVPSEYSSRGRTYDYEGTNRGFAAANVPEDDVAQPASGYLWDAVTRAGLSFRNYGEFVVRADSPADGPPDETSTGTSARPGRYVGTKPALRTTTSARYPGFDLNVRDARRADVWLEDFARDVAAGTMPSLEIVRLPSDHTAGLRAGSPTPTAYVADNDLALGRIVEAVSRSPYWRSTAFFVVEDDAQNGPDHVDSHRSVLLVVSPYAVGGTLHRWVNTTDVVATMLEILHAPSLSQFDRHGRPLREIWASAPDLRPYAHLTPAADSLAVNPRATRGARESARLDLSAEDRADEARFNRVLWRALKGSRPYPMDRRASTAEVRRGY